MSLNLKLLKLRVSSIPCWNIKFENRFPFQNKGNVYMWISSLSCFKYFPQFHVYLNILLRLFLEEIELKPPDSFNLLRTISINGHGAGGGKLSSFTEFPAKLPFFETLRKNY